MFYLQEYAVFETEVASKVDLYNKLHSLVDSHSVISITPESWKEIEMLWKQLEMHVSFFDNLKFTSISIIQIIA